jgi:cellobiose-specific phosphotransferase system component IIA
LPSPLIPAILLIHAADQVMTTRREQQLRI